MKKLYSIYACITTLILTTNITFSQINYQKLSNAISISPPSVLYPGTIVRPDTIIDNNVRCGTASLDSATIVNQPWFGNNQFLTDFINGPDYSGGAPSYPAARVVTAKYPIPVKAWVYRRNDGVALANDIQQIDVEQIIRELNRIFENARQGDGSVGIQFYLNCSVDFVNNTAYYENIENDRQTNNMFESFREQGHVNIHFIRTNRDDFGGRAARSTEPTNRRFSAAVVSTGNIGRRVDNVNIANTLAHEIGHVFNLDHTHDPGRAFWNSDNNSNGKCYQEPVSRTRRVSGEGGLCALSWLTGDPRKCEINGDRLCDTEADPNVNRQVDRNCIYGGGGTDKWSDAWNPPVNNIMSYSFNADGRTCRLEFSPMQVAVMNYQILKFFAEYQFVFINPEFDTFEPDNLQESAQLITFNQDQLHTFHWQPEVRVNGAAEACDVDWVQFQVNSTQQYEIETKAVPGKPTPDTEITLFLSNAGNLTQLATDDDTGEGNLSRLIVTLNPGNYRLRITQKNGYPAPESRGHYFVKVADVCYDFANANLTIAGPALLCASGTTYTVQNLPDVSTSTTWSAGAGININPTTGFATSQPEFNGTSTVTATVTNSNCGSRSITRTVQINAPPTTLNASPSLGSLCPTDQIELWVTVEGGATNYLWSTSGDIRLLTGANNARATISASSTFNYGTVQVSFTNACGIQQQLSKSYSRSDNCSSYAYAIYPNPADEYVEVAADEEIENNLALEESFEVKVYDLMGTERTKGKTYKKGEKLKLKVKDLPPGNYILHIIHSKGVMQKHLQIYRNG